MLYLKRLSVLKMSFVENSDPELSSAEDDDSDVELQKAFAKGELKPGLHAIVPFVRKDVINNINGMKQKLEDLTLNLDWLERLDLINAPLPLSQKESTVYGDLELKKNKKGKIVEDPNEDKVHNDFKREMTFYRQAQASVLEAVPKLHKLKVKTKRPEDYFAQMAKSDEHMKRVRSKLLEKEKVIERSEKAKKLRELRKYGKQIQREVLQKRQKEKKEMINQVKKYRKGGQQGALDFLEGNKKGKKKAQYKKEYKESKFGYGGQKKRSKYNTADSSADTAFSGRNTKMGGGKKGKKTTTRPGKNRRQQLKNRKKR